MTTTEIVRCPTCRGIHHVDVEDTAYVCPLCSSSWRWAICATCDRMELALAGQESWRCRGCARYTRAWWRTGSTLQDAAEVQHRRKELRNAGIKSRLAAPRRKRQIVGATVLAAVTTVALLVGLATAFPGGRSVDEQTRVACVRFGELRSDYANGAVDTAELATELSVIRRHADGGEPAVAAAGRDLVPPTAANSATFLVAQSRFARACELSSAT